MDMYLSDLDDDLSDVFEEPPMAWTPSATEDPGTTDPKAKSRANVPIYAADNRCQKCMSIPWTINEWKNASDGIMRPARLRRDEENLSFQVNHHPSFEILEQAAAAGCYLCRSFRAMVLSRVSRDKIPLTASCRISIHAKYQMGDSERQIFSPAKKKAKKANEYRVSVSFVDSTDSTNSGPTRRKVEHLRHLTCSETLKPTSSSRKSLISTSPSRTTKRKSILRKLPPLFGPCLKLIYMSSLLATQGQPGSQTHI